MIDERKRQGPVREMFSCEMVGGIVASDYSVMMVRFGEREESEHHHQERLISLGNDTEV